MKWHFYNPKFEYQDKFTDIDPYSAWVGHKNFGYDLIRNIKPKVIVELGTHKGTSFFSMCQAVKDENYNAKLFAVDTWKGDNHTGKYNSSVYNKVESVVKHIYSKQNIHLLKKTFDDANKEFKNHTIDLIHIDGLHTYEAVKHDFEQWLPKLSKNSIILLHDTEETKDDFGVYKLWDEIKSKHPVTISFKHYHGLGVVFVNPKNNIEIIEDEFLTNIYNEKSKNNDQNNEIYKLKKHIDEIDNENLNLKKDINQYEIIFEENRNLNIKLQTLKDNIYNIEQSLLIIKSSKFFKTWQLFTKFKKIF